MSDALLSRLLSLSEAITGAGPRDALVLSASARALLQDLETEGDRWLVEGADADQVAEGVRHAQAAIELGPAVLALDTATLLDGRGESDMLSRRVVAIQYRLARGRALSALKPLAQVSHTEAAPPVPALPQRPAAQPAPAAGIPDSAPAAMDLPTLLNIATYHRAHERYYVAHFTQAAVELYHESGKLRVIAERWLGDGPAQAAADVDYGHPAYRAAGCVDLNVLSAIPTIGVLFMEGEAEPAELRVMKARLAALAASWPGTGRWLADKMAAAWQREQALFTEALIHLAQPRFNTIATNWRGAREMTLAGRLVALALAHLQSLDLTAAGVRKDRRSSGRRLLDAAAMLAMAAQTDARSGAELADNDRNWSAYLDGLAPLIPGVNR